MRIDAFRVMAVVFAATGVGAGCAVSAPDEQVEHVDTDVPVHTGKECTDTGASGGGAEPCECAAPRGPLRVVRVVDSRGLEPNTVVMAASHDPQTLWLPEASDNVGAFVVVKEASGVARRITVLVLDGGDVAAEHEATEARASRTFMSVAGESGTGSWLLLDGIDTGI